MEIKEFFEWWVSNPVAIAAALALYGVFYLAKAPIWDGFSAFFNKVVVRLIEARIERAERHQKQRLAIELREAEARLEIQRLEARAIELRNQQQRVETEFIEQIRNSGGVSSPTALGCPVDVARRTGKHRTVKSPAAQPETDGEDG